MSCLEQDFGVATVGCLGGGSQTERVHFLCSRPLRQISSSTEEEASKDRGLRRKTGEGPFGSCCTSADGKIRDVGEETGACWSRIFFLSFAASTPEQSKYKYKQRRLAVALAG